MRREPPFHKQRSITKQAGQIVPELVLGDYVHNKVVNDPVMNKPKLTMEEWFAKNEDRLLEDYGVLYGVVEEIWKAAQENA